MARDAVPIVASVMNDKVAQGAGVAITPANGGNIAALGVTDNLLLIIDHTTVSGKNLTIKAGVYPPGFRAGIGDVVLALAASTKYYIRIESARFVQADGSINIDFETGMTGTAFCEKAPPEVL